MHPSMHPAMHPTTFELNAFGRSRLPGAQGRAVLRHLSQGCARCRAALAAPLMIWLDEGPAAEARGSDPRDHGRALVAAHLLAARRAFRAATQLSTPRAADPDVGQALALLESAGPAAIGRMPRRLLGPAVVEALLHLTSTLGARDPRLRLRFAELASDLARRDTSDERRARELRCRAAVELANAYRVLNHHRSAQAQLDLAREELLRGDHDPLVAARLLVIQGLDLSDQWRFAAAHETLSAAVRIYRRRARRLDLAQAVGVSIGNLGFVGPFDDARHCRFDALQVLDREREPAVFAATVHGMCLSLLEAGRWREGLDLLRRERTLLTAHAHGRNAARVVQVEGRLLHRAGDVEGAARAFAMSRDIYKSHGHPYNAGVESLFWAAALEERGDWRGSWARILEGTDLILKQNPEGNVYNAVMLLRTTKLFSATRDALPLDGVIAYLQRADTNPDLRLESFLD
jgi:tetratricopeptide (TPR) repeat protein